MTRSLQEFTAQRADTLAWEFLTRSPEIDLHRFDDEIDFIATLHPSTAGFMAFGAKVKGTEQELANEHAARRYLTSSLSLQKHKVKKSAYFIPMLCVVYSTRFNNGYYAWLTKPDIVNDKPVLTREDVLDCKPIEQDSLSEIIDQIRTWYDLLATELIPQA